MPASRIERWLKTGDYSITAAAESTEGLTTPYKLRLQVADGTSFSAKYKRAPDDLEAFNNSPRREVAAYEIQKLFLDEDAYVVPPTVITCLPVERYRALLPDIETHDGADCAIGVLAYWIEGLTEDDVFDPEEAKVDPAYRESLGNLNILTILIAHEDNLGENFYRWKRPATPRLFAVDNGLSLGAMGQNPIQIFTNDWSDPRLDVLPHDAVERLRRIQPKAMDDLAVLAQLERRGPTYVSVPPSAPLDRNEGVRRRGAVIQLGLTAEEITEINVRLVELLGKIGAGEIREVAGSGYDAAGAFHEHRPPSTRRGPRPLDLRDVDVDVRHAHSGDPPRRHEARSDRAARRADGDAPGRGALEGR